MFAAGACLVLAAMHALLRDGVPPALLNVLLALTAAAFAWCSLNTERVGRCASRVSGAEDARLRRTSFASCDWMRSEDVPQDGGDSTSFRVMVNLLG